MPFTPFHMGPGIAIKAILRGSFSLMVFGWAQVVMDVQPLLAMIAGSGRLHGFSHTYIGATLLAVFAALSGKCLSEIGLFVLEIKRQWPVQIAWRVAFLSAFIGTYSHVMLDSIMHADVEPFHPFSGSNDLLGFISVPALHRACLFSAAVGGVVYFAVSWLQKRNRRAG